MMKKFIITQLNALQDYKVEMRQAKRDNAQEGLKAASDDINSLVEAFNDIVAQKPELKLTVEPLIKQVRKTGRSVKTAISEQKKALEDFTRKENIYMSIMSLQQFAINITHAVRTTLNQIAFRTSLSGKSVCKDIPSREKTSSYSPSISSNVFFKSTSSGVKFDCE